MDNLELLIKLQEYYNEIYKAKNILNDKTKLINLKKMKEEYDKRLTEYKNIRNKINVLEDKYSNMISEVKKIKADNKLLEDSLYKGSNGCNFKFINSTQKKIQSQIEKLNKLEEGEEKVLKEEEELMNLKQNYEKKLEEYKNDFYNLKNQVIKELQDAKKQKLKNEKLINDTRRNIPQDILEIFDHLNSTKYPAVVPVIKGSCGGCKMSLSIIKINNLKNNKDDKLIYCENCGRIIYMPEKFY